MAIKVAHFFSYVFHPIFIPFYGLLLLFNTGLYISFTLSEEAISLIYLIVFFNTILVPSVLMYLFYKMGIINSLMVEERRQRFILYITMIVFYYSTYLLFQKFSIPLILSIFVLGASGALCILFLTNFFIKISAHMVGIGGVFGMLYATSELFLINYSNFLIPTILIAGIIGYSRLRLNAHKPIEIYLGLGIGFMAEYLTVYSVLLT